MESEKNFSVASAEAWAASFERTNRRLWILCIILVIALLGTNAGWIYRELQFEVVESTEITQDIDTGEGDAIVTGTGDIYGESSSDS